jgi:hypothetical protein
LKQIETEKEIELEQVGTQKENAASNTSNTSNTKRKLEPDGLSSTAEFRTATSRGGHDSNDSVRGLTTRANETS